MDPKHIEEYVARQVIMHMKYRDNEIEALQKELEILREELEEFDVILCSWCHKYRKYDRSCEFCDRLWRCEKLFQLEFIWLQCL